MCKRLFSSKMDSAFEKYLCRLRKKDVTVDLIREEEFMQQIHTTPSQSRIVTKCICQRIAYMCHANYGHNVRTLNRQINDRVLSNMELEKLPNYYKRVGVKIYGRSVFEAGLESIIR